MYFFENQVNPKRIRGTVMGKIFNSQYKVKYDQDKFTGEDTGSTKKNSSVKVWFISVNV